VLKFNVLETLALEIRLNQRYREGTLSSEVLGDIIEFLKHSKGFKANHFRMRVEQVLPWDLDAYGWYKTPNGNGTVLCSLCNKDPYQCRCPKASHRERRQWRDKG